MIALRLSGRTPYVAALALQEALVAARAEGSIDDVVVFLEHPETITVGRHRGAASSVLVPETVPVVEVSRGGDATWHAPGQLVAYPIVALEGDRRDLRAFLTHLEQAVVDMLVARGHAAQRDARNTGVWLPAEGGLPQKVCSIGIACRKWVTWHGLALNLDIDLGGFARIKPCGFGSEVMTRLVDHGDPASPDELVAPLAKAIARVLDLGKVAYRFAELSDAEEVPELVEALQAASR